ncbi:phosphonate C-P lyase system protein PhnH [Paenibacillus sp. HJGM_3]|uniref:phosphonate C-P lyase system protein PhnH n=1 Tax=Paenibacillus sp. HJGM_3 TaxID=3379816 RepID=UPI00385C390B
MPNVKERPFDRVHDTQFIYRQLLEALARPGQIGSIAAASARVEAASPLLATATCFALTLLDGEVGFAVAMEAEKEALEAHIRRQTFSRIAALPEVDYVFASGGEAPERIEALLAQVKKGTLIRPEGGAILFVLVEGFESFEPGQSPEACWTLSGPGIKDTCRLCVQGLSPVWMEQRALANAEYPMGVDLVLYTVSGELAALPRTTQVHVQAQEKGVR